MIQTNKKACKELLTHRMLLAVLLGIAMQFLVVSCLFIITNLSADYTSWFQEAWNATTSFRMWSCFIILSFVTFLQGVVCSKRYLNKPLYLKNRFLKVHRIFAVQNLFLAALYVTIGGILIWLHLTLEGGKYHSLIASCNKIPGSCLMEEHYFLLLSGFWSGLYFFFQTSFLSTKYLTFPIIPLSKFSQLKRQICTLLPSLIITSLWPTLYYMVAYYFLGSYCRTAIISITSTQIENEPLNSLLALFNMSLILHLWLYQLIFMLTINTMYVLFEVCLTEWVPFEFSQSNIGDRDNLSVTLPEALSMDEVPIMQHLGFFDLVTLAQKDVTRRCLLFTLSQPGGHPYNWNCILEKCLSIIKKFSADITAVTNKTKEPLLYSTVSTPMSTNIHVYQKEYSYHMRKLVMENVPPSSTTDTNVKQLSSIYQFIKSKWDNFITYLISKPLIYYIFGEQDDKKVQYILCNGQPVIWAIDAISTLSVLSLTEDSYGIVQKDLPIIIDALLTLKQSLDKLQKSNILVKKQQSDDKSFKTTFTSLRSAAKRSLYRIIIGFENHITDLALDTPTIEQLYSFLNYKE